MPKRASIAARTAGVLDCGPVPGCSSAAASWPPSHGTASAAALSSSIRTPLNANAPR